LAQNKKPKPQHKPKPLVKSNPPINKAQTKAAASQEVDYFAVTANGNQSKDHVVGLSEKFIGHIRMHIFVVHPAQRRIPT
jgi:hypothetical protein